MKRPRSVRAWLGLALVFLVVAVPAYADVTSDLIALFFQVDNTASNAGFTQGERNSLVVKVIGALRDAQRGDFEAVSGKLGAFLNEVEALEQSGRLSSGDAQALTDSANAIIGQLGV